MRIITNTLITSVSLFGAAVILAFQQHFVMSKIFMVLFGIGLLLDSLMKDYKEKDELPPNH